MKKKSVQRDLPHIRVYEWMAKSPAYRSLSVYARCLYAELKRRYNGSNNGGIIMSFREAVELVGCSGTPLRKAFAELQEKGFIKSTQKGAFSWKARIDGKNRATTWLLTEYKADLPSPSITPSKDFMRWFEIQAKEKTRCTERTPMVHPEDTMCSETVHPENTKRILSVHHVGHNSPPDGAPRAHTNSIPQGVGGREDVTDAA